MKSLIIAVMISAVLVAGLALAADKPDEGHYIARARCYNCGTMVEYQVPKGVPAKDYRDLVDCQNCGCMNETPPDRRGMLADPQDDNRRDI